MTNIEVSTMTLNIAEGNIKQSRGLDEEEDWTVGLKNICVRKSRYRLLSAHESTGIIFWRQFFMSF